MTKPILITRPQADASIFGKKLIAEGFSVDYLPVIQTIAVPENHDFELALKSLDSYDWILLTSKNAVKFFYEKAKELDVSLDFGNSVTATKFATVGNATADYMESFGMWANFVPDQNNVEGLLSEFRTMNFKGKKCLIASSNKADEKLSDGLEDLGAIVEKYITYMTTADDSLAMSPKLEDIANGTYSCVCFFSPSSFEFLQQADSKCIKAHAANGGKTAAIGRTTARAMREEGVEPDIIPGNSNQKSLVKALKKHLQED